MATHMRQTFITCILAAGLFWAIAQPPWDNDLPNNTLDILKDTILPGGTQTTAPMKKSAADTTPAHKQVHLADPKQAQQEEFIQAQKRQKRGN